MERDGGGKEELTPGEKSGDQVARELEERHDRARASYYRHILRGEDEAMLRRVQKIPDSWDGVTLTGRNGPLRITPEQKKRLTDIKKLKAWELKFESLNIAFLLTLEKAVYGVIAWKETGREELDEARDAAQTLILEIGGNISNFKHLLLSLAKRAISDLYYLILAHGKFSRRTGGGFEDQFGDFCRAAVERFTAYGKSLEHLEVFRKYRDRIGPFFTGSSNKQGWRINEAAVKMFLDGSTEENRSFMHALQAVVASAYRFNRQLKSDYDFLVYYNNEHDGRLFRLNFVVDSLSRKLDEKKISSRAYELFSEIRDSFIAQKKHFESRGIAGFGPGAFNYHDSLEFTHKACQIIEYHLLRTLQYDELKAFRSNYSYRIQKEYYQFHPE